MIKAFIILVFLIGLVVYDNHDIDTLNDGNIIKGAIKTKIVKCFYNKETRQVYDCQELQEPK